jgi:hypothetical protein
MAALKRYSHNDGKMESSLNGEWCRVAEASPLMNLGAEFELLFERLKKLGDVRLEDLVKEYETQQEHIRLQQPRVEPSEHTREFLRVAPGDQAKGFYIVEVTDTQVCLRINPDVHFWIKYFNTTELKARGHMHVDRRLRITSIRPPMEDNNAD